MDCCNYVQPYPGHGHFYQQHFCYDNMNGYAGGYGAAPIADTIEVNARYARLHAAYPTDYVYNPKEARLRKAMREQNRELSRQSVLSAPISTPENATNNTGSNSTPVSTNFINLSMTCSSPAPPGQSGSSLSGSSSYNPGRINPWFPIGHATPGDHVKQMIPYRMMQAHQRTFDKAKDVLRNQTSIAECGTAFPSSSPASCYPGDFSLHGSAQQSRISPVDSDTRTNGTGLESNDYCGIGEFTDGQKWHPYQNGPTTYHSRSGPMTKISTRHAMQNVNTINSHAQGPWNQFCGVSMSPMAAQSPLIRSPRHMVMLQNQQERHCFPDELPLPYVTNKIDLAPRMPPGYSQSTYREAEKGLDGAPRWQSGNPEPPVNNLMTQQPEAHVEDNQKQPKKEETKDFTDDETDKPEMPSKQPLPGFHQAFGSTEIGRFSRSEFFANMVSENGNVSRCIDRSQSNHRTSDSSSCSGEAPNGLLHSPCDFNGLCLTPHCEGVRNSIPRWHSPYVSAITGEI